MSTLCTPLQVPPVRCSVFVLFCSQFSELSSGSACVCVCSIRFRSANSVASAWLYLCKWSRFVSQQTIRIGLRSKRAAAIGKLSICAKCERTSRWAALPLFSFSKKKTKIQAFCLCGVGISYSSRALCFAWPNSPRTASVSPFEPANSRFQVSIDRSNSVSGRQLNFHPIISGAFEAIFGVSPVSVSSAFSVFVYKYVRTIRCQACAIVLVWWCFDDHLRLVSWGADRIYMPRYDSIAFYRMSNGHCPYDSMSVIAEFQQIDSPYQHLLIPSLMLISRDSKSFSFRPFTSDLVSCVFWNGHRKTIERLV